MKSKEELNELKEEVETLDEKLHELTEEELAQVVGGAHQSAAFLSTVTLIGSGTIPNLFGGFGYDNR